MRLRYRYLILLCSLLIALPGVTQELAVESFRLLENEISPNIEGPNKRIDQNGEVAALIKIQTTEKGFVFEGGLLGIVDTKQDVGEIYVWVPRSAKRITIKHPQLGVLRNYAYPIPIESGRAYEMKLISGQVQQVVQYATTEHYFVLNVSPANARVTIDGNPVALNREGAVSVLLKRGTHEFSIQAAMHRSEAGIVTITDKKEVMNVTLAPDYGVLQVSSEPQGAEVYIDGAYKPAGTTPFTTEWLSSGAHSLEFRLLSYKVYTTDVLVTGDGTTQPFTATLQPNFAEVTITAPGEADIYINDERKATGTWSGRLDAGHYRVEARKTSHTSSVQSIDVVAGDSRHITLDAPKPIYGSLNINSDPIGAKVFIDGKEIGEAPDIFTEVLIGTHTIRLTKAGCAPVEQQVTIEEGKTATLSLTLATSGKVTVTSNVVGAKIYIDDEYKGVAPYTYEAASGSYRVTAKADGYTDATRNITITAGQSTSLALAPQPISRNRTFTVKGVSFTMIPVEGGTFTMGATREQRSDAEDDEKPTHRVTISDYYIGETEVTQALWEAVMTYSGATTTGETLTAYSDPWLGSNPLSTYGVGENYPAYYVSHDDIVDIFLPRLNAITGKTFRLPTEAEWEYAARGGNKSKGYKYAGSNTIGNVAWYESNSKSKTYPVKGKQANELGLYDMSGNVWEWCSDWYGSYSSSAQTNPTGPATGSFRVCRGGCRYGDARSCRVSNRSYNTPVFRFNDLGLRLALTK